MHRLALVVLALGLALPGARAQAQEAPTHEGHELSLISVSRVKEFRDLKVKDPKKHDLIVATVELRWKGDKRHVLIQDKDLELRDARGAKYECMLRFVQAAAAPDDSPARFEIPFQVKTGAEVASLRVGKAILPIKSPPPQQQ